MNTLAHQIQPQRCKFKADINDIEYEIRKRFSRKYGIGGCVYAEPKLDGIRYLLQIKPNGANFNYLTSRRISVETDNFVEKQDVVTNLRDHDFLGYWDDTVLDGELVGGGLSSDTQHEMVNGDVVYHAFDIIRCRGEDVSSLTWDERQRLLIQFFSDHENLLRGIERVQPNEHVFGVLQDELDAGREGIVIKHSQSKYGEDWIKVKRKETFDAVVTGVEMSVAERHIQHGWIATIKLGQIGPNAEMVDCGKTSGFTDAEREVFTNLHRSGKLVGTVVEVEAQQQLRSGKFRHPRFLRIRADKNPLDCFLSSYPDEL